MQMEFHQLELTYRKLRRRDAKRQAKLLASLSEHGQQSPVMVVKQNGGTERYVLIDGYRRVAALRRLGRDTVEALALPLDEVAALCLRHQLEETKQRSVIEQGWLLAELLERHGVSQAKLGRLLGHSESWVSRRLALVRELPELVQDLVRQGRLCAHGAMRHLVPLARAKTADCVQLVEGLTQAQSPITARQLGRLSVAWRCADENERRRIVRQPLLYLRAEEASAVPQSDPPSPERLLRDDLDALRAIARRASRRLDKDRCLADRLPLFFDHLWRKTQLVVDELYQRMEARLDAGP